MKSYDWIVVGGGITGASLGYELAKKGFAVLLLERDLPCKMLLVLVTAAWLIGLARLI
jgi:Choline dehydrogenase and related flavoproteins